jgi:hypothetical protein
MEPQKINIDNSLFGKPDLPEGLCKFERNAWGSDGVESIIYYKNCGLINFAFMERAGHYTNYIGYNYAEGAGFFQESSRAHILTNLLGIDMFKASKEEIMDIFITKKHHMSDWLLFNQELWVND